MPRKHQPAAKPVRTSNEFTYMAPSGIHGKGLFARRQLPAGAELAEYDGPRVPAQEGEKLASEGNTCIFSLDRKTCIDGSVKWNLARYANHSCEPNAKPFKVNGKIFLYSLRPILKGEEITYNYGYEFKGHEKNPCNCGKPSCAGFMVQEKHKSKI